MKKQFNMFGVIVDDGSEKWSEDDVTPSDIKNFLDSCEDSDEVEILVNSPGGNVTGGLAIANMIKMSSNKVTVKIIGMAASMASVIAAAADERLMGVASFLMIHNPWGFTVGTAEEMRKTADVLDSMRDSICNFYATLFPGKSKDDITGLLDAETWIRGDQIEEFGVSASLFDQIPAFACLHGPMDFKDMPEEAKEFYAFDKKMKDEYSKPAAKKTGAGDPAPEGDKPPEGSKPPAGTKLPEGKKPPEDNVVALSAKLEETETKRRDIQSKYDQLQARVREMETTHTAALQEKDTKISSLASEVKTAESRISAMTLNALKGPTGGCAQSWDEAVKECGSYEAAVRKYPDLAAAYRKSKKH